RRTRLPWAEANAGAPRRRGAGFVGGHGESSYPSRTVAWKNKKMPDETGCSSAATKIAAAALAAVVLVSRYDSAPAQPAATEASPKPPSAMGETAAFAPAAARDAARASAAAQNEQVIPGLELDVWAPPGLVANALTLDFDPQGRAYVVSSARAGLLLDIRQHREWIPEVHSLRSTEDLRAFFRRVMAPERSADNQWLPDFNEDGRRDYR